MKKLFFALLLLSGLFLQKADAQVRVGMDINIGAQPDWGPYGYDYAQYYYFPDMDIYYDVLNREFVYFDGYEWRSSPYMPSAYSNFDLYSAYKVVINEPQPYLRADYYRRQYYGYRGYHNQPVLRDHRNEGYAYGRDERYEQRGEQRYERRDQRFDDRNRVEREARSVDQRDNRGFEQRGNRTGNNGFDQRANTPNRNVYEQRGNDNNRGGFEQRRNEGMNGTDHGGFGQRGENRDFGRH
ncbi:hypothetical protein [Flavisolibacter ginsenosidimutans]|uniref:DUF3300 domain-containing protein n=1 Tax=Flavisolibacter ginsenosidimutans TaxID=661481 RepID=A0A5B8UIR4_9BACT|nr:hypothetical protein [Flavisolibacter ginsenosidimutans]QEC56433.1 hypothetical protein FSB75_11190 [Flavisolibacter ginsenosidimutans]